MEGQPIGGLVAKPQNIITPKPGFFAIFKNENDGIIYAMDSDRKLITFVSESIYLGTTNNGAQTEIFLNGENGKRISVPDNTVIFFQAQAIATDVNTGDSGFTQVGLFIRNFNGVCSVVNGVISPDTPFSIGDAVANNWSLEPSLDTVTCQIIFKATGEVGKTIKFSVQDIKLSTNIIP